MAKLTQEVSQASVSQSSSKRKGEEETTKSHRKSLLARTQVKVPSDLQSEVDE